MIPEKPERTLSIGADLSKEIREELIAFLSNNLDCFAWSHEDMTGISSEVIVHRLNVDSSFKPVRQKRRKFAPERNKIINDEVDKLLNIGSVREVQYLLIHKYIKSKNNDFIQNGWTDHYDNTRVQSPRLLSTSERVK